MIDDTTGTQNPLPDSTEVISNHSEATEVKNPTNGPNDKETEAAKPGNCIWTLIKS